MTDDEFVEMLKRHEGVVDHAYQDSLGYWTIGVGFLIDARKGGKLLPEEIDFILKNRLDKVAAELDRKIPWWNNLSDNRRAVILDMAWNLGVPGLLGFKNTLEFIRTGQYEKAAKGMENSKWAKQVDKVLGDHKGRVDDLTDLMRKG